MKYQEHLSEERRFIENLINVRANFGLVVFGLAVAATAALQDRWFQVGVLFVALVLCSILAFATGRSQWKLDLIIGELEPQHPAKTIDHLAKGKAPALRLYKRVVVGGSRRPLVGYVLPWLTVLFLAAGTVLGLLGLLPGRDDQPASLRPLVDSLTVEVESLRHREEATMDKLERLLEEMTVIRAQAEGRMGSADGTTRTP